MIDSILLFGRPYYKFKLIITLRLFYFIIDLKFKLKMLTEDPSLFGGPPPRKNTRTMDYQVNNYKDENSSHQVDSSTDQYKQHLQQQVYLKSIQMRQGQQQRGNGDMLVASLGGQRSFQQRNADLEGDIQSLQKGKRTSTIEMAQSPEEWKDERGIITAQKDSINPSSEKGQGVPQPVEKLGGNNQNPYQQQLPAPANQYYTNGTISQNNKMSANRSSSSSRRQQQMKKSHERMRQSSNRQYSIQQSKHSGQSSGQQVDVNRLTKNDMRAALERYKQLQPADGNEPMYMGGSKTVELWQDFQKLLANQMLGEKLGPQSQNKSLKTSPSKSNSKAQKQSPLRINFSQPRSRDRNFRTSSNQGGEDLSSPSIYHTNEPQVVQAQGIDDNISLFQQGIQDAIIRHYNAQYSKPVKQKKHKPSPKKSKSQKRQKKEQAVVEQKSQKVMYKNAVKELTKDQGGPNGSIVEPFKYYQQQNQMSAQLQERLMFQRMQIANEAYQENVNQDQGEQLQFQSFNLNPNIQYRNAEGQMFQMMPRSSQQSQNEVRGSIQSSKMKQFGSSNPNSEARMSSLGRDSKSRQLANTSDFRRTTATFPTAPDKASIEVINNNYWMRNGIENNYADRNDYQKYQRISVAKLADIENELAQQMYREQQNGQEQLEQVLNTPPKVQSETQLVQSGSTNKNQPISFGNTNLNSRHQSRDLLKMQIDPKYLNQHQWILHQTGDNETQDDNEQQEPKSRQSNDSELHNVKKIALPSYRDDRNIKPTQIVRDTTSNSQSSKTSNTLTKRMNDTLQKRSQDTQDLQVIQSDRAEDISQSIDQLMMNNQQKQAILDQIKQNQAQFYNSQPMTEQLEEGSNLPPMPGQNTKSVKFKKGIQKTLSPVAKDSNTDQSGLLRYGLMQNNDKNMFSLDAFGNFDESTMLQMTGDMVVKGRSAQTQQRKISPEELIDTVNRKYGVLFGQGQAPLVGIKHDLKQLETVDFMNYLTSNERPRRSQSNRARSQEQDLSAEKKVQHIGNSRSQINLQLGQQSSQPVGMEQQLNKFVDQSLRKRSRSQLKKQFSSLGRKHARNNSRIRPHRMLSGRHNQSSSIAQKRVKFKDAPDRFARNRASSNKSLNNYKTFFRNFSEVRTADDIPKFPRKNYIQYRSLSRLPGKYGKAMILMSPTSRRKEQIENVSGTRNTRLNTSINKLNTSKSFVENEWDREEISKARYQQYLNEKNRIKQKRDPWAAKQPPKPEPQQQQGSPYKMKKSNSQRNLSEEKYHLDDQYKKVVLDIWKEVKLQNKQQLIALKRPDRFDGETQVSIQKKASNQMARIRAIQAKLKPFVFQRFSDFYQINKNMSSDIEVQKRIQALNLNEQILQKIDFDLLQVDIEIIRLRLLNAYMLLKTYQQAGDDLRVIRFMQESTNKNLYLPSLLKKLSQQGDLGELDLQNYVLFIYQLYAESLLRKGYNDESKTMFYDICKVYNRWKINNRTLQEITDLDPSQDRIFEFGIDDYIKAKASYAESIMNCGQIDHAIDKFENTKNQIENEIIYENPMIFVNVCNQLGNCYLLKQNSERALDNFEISLNMISKIEAEKQVELNMQGDQYQVDRVSPLVVAKICLNIAILRSQMGNHDEAVYMHEKSLLYKSRVLPQLHDEIRDQNILLAFAQQRANMEEQACASLNRALAIHKSHNGEHNYKAAQLYCQLANAFLKVSESQDAIENFEHACMILLKLEQQKLSANNTSQQDPNKSLNQDLKSGKQETDKTTSKLDKTYMQLLDLYMQVNHKVQCNQVISTLEARLESISNTDEYAYRMMNELANLLQKHQLHDKSIMFYKKALLCMKRRHKNRFNQQPETAKILINIASVLYMTDNVKESLKSFIHALEVLTKVAQTFEQFDGDIGPFKQLYIDALVEKGKVHMTCANILRSIGNDEQAEVHYNRAIDNFDQCCQLITDGDYNTGLSPANEMELKNIKLLMLEARTCLKSF